MKKITIILLAALLLAGCSVKEKTPQATEAKSEVSSATIHKTEEVSQAPSIKETPLLNEKDVRITALALRDDGYDYVLEVFIENNSELDLMFRSDMIGFPKNSVNGYMVDTGYISEDLAAGEKRLCEVSFIKSRLKEKGIREIAEIEVAFLISDMDYNDYLESDPVSIKTDIYDSFQFNDGVSDKFYYLENYSQIDSQEKDFYSENGVNIFAQTMFEDEDGSKLMLIEAENTSDQPVNVTFENFSLNGLFIEKHNSVYINPHCKAIEEIWFPEPQLMKLCGIDAVGKVTADVTVSDEDYEESSEKVNLTFSETDPTASFLREGTEVYSADGIRMISMGLAEYESGFTPAEPVLLVENSTDEPISVWAKYDSLKINGTECDVQNSGIDIGAGQWGLLTIGLYDSDLEDMGITPADIENVEFAAKISFGDFDSIDTPPIKVEY